MLEASFICLLLISSVSSTLESLSLDEPLSNRKTKRDIQVSITTTWNDLHVDHRPVDIQLKPHSDNQSFQMVVKAPFFNDPVNPRGVPGEPFFGLWNYEVVELFLANDKDQYLEIELCPWGQHIVLLLNGTHNTIHHSLPLHFTILNRSADEWLGRAIIPLRYLPPRVTKMNAYAIHGSDSRRVYEALYPSPNGLFPNPDLYSSISILFNCCALHHLYSLIHLD